MASINHQSYGSSASGEIYSQLMISIQNEQEINNSLTNLSLECNELMQKIEVQEKENNTMGGWVISMMSWGESAEKIKLKELKSCQVLFQGELESVQEKIRTICSEILKPSAGPISSEEARRTRVVKLFALIIILEFSKSLNRIEFEGRVLEHCHFINIDSKDPFIKPCIEKLRRLPKLSGEEIASQSISLYSLHSFGASVWYSTLVGKIREIHALNQATPLIAKAIDRLTIRQEDSSTNTILSKSLAKIIQETYNDMLDEYELLPIFSDSDRNREWGFFTGDADSEIYLEIRANRESLQQKLVGLDENCLLAEISKLRENKLLPRTRDLVLEIVTDVLNDLYVKAIVDATSTCAKEIGPLIEEINLHVQEGICAYAKDSSSKKAI